jgi:hypothetical protein
LLKSLRSAASEVKTMAPVGATVVGARGLLREGAVRRRYKRFLWG